MKTAIVGLGVIGAVHNAVLNDLGITPVAMCDIDRKKLDNYTCDNKFADYIEMLNSTDIDVVHICTPHYLHADMIIEALSRNINVLCEKPLCIKEEDIERILQAEKNSKAILGVCHQNRYNPENIFVKEYLKDKENISGYGTVVWKRNASYYAQDKWRGKWATEGGGVLINQALHTLDLLIWFCGQPNRVYSKIDNVSLKNVIEVEDTAFIKCSDGGEFTFYATNASASDFPVFVKINSGETHISVEAGTVNINGKLQDFKNDYSVLGKKCYGTGHRALIKDFYDCVSYGKKFSIDGAEAAKVIKVILKVYKDNKL